MADTVLPPGAAFTDEWPEPGCVDYRLPPGSGSLACQNAPIGGSSLSPGQHEGPADQDVLLLARNDNCITTTASFYYLHHFPSPSPFS